MDLIKALMSLFLVFITALLIVLIMAIPAMFLWNWLMPLIFGLMKLTFIQMVGLLWLSHLLFSHIQWNNKKKE